MSDQGSIIHDSQKVETIQMSAVEWNKTNTLTQ